MVRPTPLLAWLLLATAAQAAGAQADFSVRANRTKLALGEPLTLEIRTPGATPPLDSIHLDRLKRAFDVYAVSSDTATRVRNGRSRVTQSLTVTLYPLHAGHLRVPALSFRGRSSKPLAIRVRRSGPGVPRVRFKVSLDPAAPLVRQAATLHLDIYDDGSLQWSPFKLPQSEGLYLRRLGQGQQQRTVDGTRYTVHRYAWALMALRDGKLRLRFPMLGATKFGAHLRYAVSALSFSAKPLPAYLPVYVPVGKPSLTAAPLPARLPLNRPVDWNLTVRGSGLSREGLSRLLFPLAHSRGLHFYPPAISLLGPPSRTSPQQTWHVALPLRPLRAGTVELPEIRLPYYDLGSRRLEALRLSGPTVVVTNPLWRGILVAAAGGSGLLLALGLGVWLHKRLRRVRARRMALKRVAEAATADELTRALLAFAPPGVPPCVTLGQWLRRLECDRGVDASLRELIAALQAARFAKGYPQGPLAELKVRAAAALTRIGMQTPMPVRHQDWRRTLFGPEAQRSRIGNTFSARTSRDGGPN